MFDWPLIRKFLLAVAGPTLAILLAWVAIRNNSITWFQVALVAGLGWTVLQGVDAWRSWWEEEAIHQGTSSLLDYLIREIQHASAMEQRIRGDVNAEERLEQYRDEVEGWRTEIGDELEVRVPRSGASQVFLAALGETGRGPLYWEYTQLRGCHSALTNILGASDSFVRRSRSSVRVARIQQARGTV